MSALMICLVVALFVAAALRLSIGNLSASTGDEQKALFAAESGLRYVQTRLAADYNWNGDGGLVVNEPDLIIQEREGNIIGLVRYKDEGFAQFRIRFNYQDDAQGDTDGRNDPPAAFRIDNKYVSVSNMLGGAAMPVPRATGPDWSVTSSSPSTYSVPGSSTCVIVEGRYGPGLNQLSASNINPKVQGKCSTRHLEAYLEVTDMAGANSAAMSAGKMEFNLASSTALTLSAKNENSTARIRSRSTIEVLGGSATNLIGNDADALTKSGTVKANYKDLKPDVEDTKTEFYKLPWSEVKKASPTDSSLKAGTYVIWDDGSLHYYDKNYSDYASDIILNPNDPGTVIDPTSLPPGLSYDGNKTKPSFTVSQNIHIDNSSTSSTEFSLIPRAGVQEDPPGAPNTDTDTQMAQSFLGSLGVANKIGSGNKRATWEVPISGSVPGGKIRIREKKLLFFTGQEIYLEQTGPGKAQLVLNDNLITDFNPSIKSDPIGALNYAFTKKWAGNSKISQMLLLLTGGLSMSEFDFTSISPQLRADDISINFAPPKGKTAILSSESTIRIGSNVKGDGGSITSGESIRIAGNGTELAASLEDGLTLYAKKDVVLSSLKETKVGSNDWYYKDLKLKGVLYSWGNIQVKMDNPIPTLKGAGSLQVEGSIVAYGGDPSGAVGSGLGGDIRVWSEGADLKYNPAYLLRMDLDPPPGTLSQTLYNSF